LTYRRPRFAGITGLTEVAKSKIRRFFRKKKVVATFIVVFAFFLSEIYAHNYVYVHSLPVLTEEQAFDELRRGAWSWNGTYEFSSSSCRWLVVWKLPGLTSEINYFHVFIFKIYQSSSLWIQRTDLAVWSHPTSNCSGCYGVAYTVPISYGEYIGLDIPYITETGPGTYEIDLGVRVRIYQETLLGLLPQDEIALPINATVSYGA